jgi:flagellar hook-basal body complex protein FliE
MSISSIGGGLSPLTPKLPSAAGGADKAAGTDFGSALKDAGEPIDVHEVMLNTEQASLGFSMALQVRNKLVDAYQEVMRMSV